MRKLLLACVASLLCGQALAAPFSCDNTHQCLSATSGNVANGTVAATLPAAPGQVTFITGLHMAAGGATAASSVDCTITGLVSGTQTFTFVYSTLNAYTSRDLIYNPPIPASASNTAIVASCPAGGSGAAHASMNLEGYRY